MVIIENTINTVMSMILRSFIELSSDVLRKAS